MRTMKVLGWVILAICLGGLFFLLQGCGGDDANVDSQEFYNDFGTPVIYFHTADCHHKLVVGDMPDIWTLFLDNSQTYNLHGVDREVIHDVGIQYSTDDFKLIKYFDGTITMDYMNEHCQINVTDLN